MPRELPELVVPHAAAWRRWLEAHCDSSLGVWLVLAKKGTTDPTTLTYDQALDEALCHGWIDGQVSRRDESTYRQRFTPRQRRSAWSQTNLKRASQLLAEGRMHPFGVLQVEQAKADGRWDMAYAGSAEIDVPDDVERALAKNPAAGAMFGRLTRQNRYAILYRVTTAKRPETRARRIDTFVEMLARGETIHPQSSRR